MSAHELVQLRFRRTLTPVERERLEAHLAGCDACVEEYRRLQLAHRVLAIGPERALDEPAPLELERIAGDLGLLDPEPEVGLFSRIFAARGLWQVGLGAALALGLAAVVVVGPRSTIEDELVARGDATSGVTFAAFVVSKTGEVRAHAPDAPLAPSDVLKLRAAVPSELAGDVRIEVLLAPEGGEPRALVLGRLPRDGGASAVTVPGSVPLRDLSGRAIAWIFAVRGGDLPEGEVSARTVALRTLADRALADRPTAEAARARLARDAAFAAIVGLERVDLVVRSEGPAP